MQTNNLKKITSEEEFKFTNEQIARNDEIDNAVYQMLLVLLETDEESFPWDMHIIGEVTDAIKAECQNFNLHVRHPGYVLDEKGYHYEE